MSYIFMRDMKGARKAAYGTGGGSSRVCELNPVELSPPRRWADMAQELLAVDIKRRFIPDVIDHLHSSSWYLWTIHLSSKKQLSTMTFGIRSLAGNRMFGQSSIATEGELEFGRVESPIDQAPPRDQAPPVDHGPLDDLAMLEREMEKLDNDYMNQRGLGALCGMQRQDNMYMFSSRLTEPTLYCIHSGTFNTMKQYLRVLEAEETSSDELEEMRKELDVLTYRTLKLMKVAAEVQSMEKPNKGILLKFIFWARPKLSSENAHLLLRWPQDWAMLVSIDKFKHYSSLVQELRIWNRLMSRFRKKTEEDDLTTHYTYSDKPQQVLATTATIFFTSVFYAVPLAILGLNILSLGGQVAVALVALFVFTLVAQWLLTDDKNAMFFALAFVSLLSNMLK
ncbi:hypothetical protein G7046_g2041 [Stylonectria norvegica]|nr:hypothetical protein G7046_g2041 [Stylonectria norvegica]